MIETDHILKAYNRVVDKLTTVESTIEIYDSILNLEGEPWLLEVEGVALNDGKFFTLEYEIMVRGATIVALDTIVHNIPMYTFSEVECAAKIEEILEDWLDDQCNKYARETMFLNAAPGAYLH